MAFIQCPECHKEISDSVPSCIYCGFSVQEYNKRKILEEELQQELKSKLNEIDNMSLPARPDYFKECSIFAIISVGFFIMGVVTLLLFSKGIPFNSAIGVILIIISGIAFITWRIFYTPIKEDYEKKKNDWDGYKEAEKAKIVDKYKTYSRNIEKYGNRDGANITNSKRQTENIIKCPACGSTKVKKISGARKVISTELWGLASSDIGKQMECENCGYKF